MKARAGRLLALIGVSGAIVMAAGAPSASAAKLECEATIQGAGSSLQNIAQTKVWSPEWKAASSPECTSAVKVEYRSSSTGKAKAQWGSSNKELNAETTAEKEEKEAFPAFLGADVGPSTLQQTNMDIAGEEKTAQTLNEIVAVPVEQSGISVMVTLPVGCEPETGKTVSVATGVHLQEEWEKHTLSFSQLLSNLKSSTACSEPISLEARSSASGTTAGFKRFLGSIGTEDLVKPEKAEWATVNATPEESESTTWPTGGDVHPCCEKGSQLAETVHSTAGDVGYADLADAEAAAVGFTPKWVKHTVGAGSQEAYSSVVQINTNGESISPEASNKESNCSNAEYVEPSSVGPNVNWSGARQENTEKAESGAYPICTLTFDLAWHRYSFPTRASGPKISYTQKIRNTVFEYLHWIVTSGQKLTKLAEEHYGKLSSGTQKKAETGVTETNIAF